MSDASKLGSCPDCKRMISLTAAICPQCGRTIQEGDLVPIASNTKPISPGCILLTAVAVILLIIFFTNQVEQRKDEDRERLRIIEMEQRRGGR